MEFTFNKESILTTLAQEQTITLGENPIEWQVAEEVTIAFDEIALPKGWPFSFVEYPDGRTVAIHDISDIKDSVLDAPVESVYYIYPDIIHEEIYLWVRKDSGWYPGAANLECSKRRRKVDELISINSSDLFSDIRKANGYKKPFVIFYHIRNEGGVELCEKEITEYHELVDIIFNQNVLSIKYAVISKQQPVILTYSRAGRDSWKRLI